MKLTAVQQMIRERITLYERVGADAPAALRELGRIRIEECRDILRQLEETAQEQRGLEDTKRPLVHEAKSRGRDLYVITYFDGTTPIRGSLLFKTSEDAREAAEVLDRARAPKP